MSKFSVEEFMLEPDQDVFDCLKKDDLIALATHLGLIVKNRGVK